MPLGKGQLAGVQLSGQPHICTFFTWNHVHMSFIRKVIKMQDVDSGENVHVWGWGKCGKSLYLHPFNFLLNLKLF